jgi:hypothetical protein
MPMSAISSMATAARGLRRLAARNFTVVVPSVLSFNCNAFAMFEGGTSVT